MKYGKGIGIAYHSIATCSLKHKHTKEEIQLGFGVNNNMRPTGNLDAAHIDVHSENKKNFRAPLSVLQLVMNRGLVSVPGSTK